MAREKFVLSGSIESIVGITRQQETDYIVLDVAIVVPGTAVGENRWVSRFKVDMEKITTHLFQNHSERGYPTITKGTKIDVIAFYDRSYQGGMQLLGLGDSETPISNCALGEKFMPCYAG